MEETKTTIIACEGMQGICKYNDYGVCKLRNITLECGECSNFEEDSNSFGD